VEAELDELRFRGESINRKLLGGRFEKNGIFCRQKPRHDGLFALVHALQLAFDGRFVVDPKRSSCGSEVCFVVVGLCGLAFWLLL
jgi:hypothetical protein